MANSSQFPGTPLNECSSRSASSNHDPATRSLTPALVGSSRALPTKGRELRIVGSAVGFPASNL